MKYTKVKSDFDKPEFKYILLTNEKIGGYMGYTPDYYLYYEDELENAFKQLHVESARGIDHAFIGGIEESVDGSYKVTELFCLDDNKILVGNEEELLHFNWYVHAGNWLNQR